MNMVEKFFGKIKENEDADGFSIWIFGAIIVAILVVLLIVIPNFTDTLSNFVNKLPLKINFTVP